MNEISPPEQFHIDKRQLRTAFDRAAASYEEAAVLQQEIGCRLLERLDLMRMEPAGLLDAGAGTGILSAALTRRYRSAHIVSLDISMAMLDAARRRAPRLARWRGRQVFVCADVERLPLGDRCVDMVVSNLMLQWCNDLERALAELRRVLRPGGLLMFTTFGPDTLKELRASWQGVDTYNHVNVFIDMHDIGDALLRTGFAEPVMDREDIRMTYASVQALMHDLKALGAHNITGGRPRGLTGPGRLAKVVAAYETYRRDGRLPATYEVIYGHCWAAAQGGDARRQGPGQDVRIPVSDIHARSRK